MALMMNDSGEWVRLLQRYLRQIQLKAVATPGLVVDGKYGPKTAAAVKKVEAFVGEPQTGIASDKVLFTIGFTPDQIAATNKLPLPPGGIVPAVTGDPNARAKFPTSTTPAGVGVPAGSAVLWELDAQNQFNQVFRGSGDAGKALQSELANFGLSKVAVADQSGIFSIGQYALKYTVQGTTARSFPDEASLKSALEGAASRAGLNVRTTKLFVGEGKVAGDGTPPAPSSGVGIGFVIGGVLLLALLLRD